MKNKHDNNGTGRTGTGRRDFLKLAGMGVGVGAAAATAALYGCKPAGRQSAGAGGTGPGETSAGEMTLRANPSTGDKVSLLGYGCMRWPMRQKADGSGEEIDQDTVNALVDHAIARGVNYFDTAPVYCRGWSETATGIALKRHPRDKFFIATKLSNHRSTESYSFDASVKLYRQSFKDLQVDYIDYYLLHNVGTGGMKTFRERFYENGMVDFLLKEREAGRIRNLGWSFHGDIGAFDFLLAQDTHWDFAQIQLNYLDWRHATGANTNAEYLYGELLKRKIPAVIMEPLLGGRLSRVHDHIVARLKQREPDRSVASWAFRFAGTFPNVLTVLSGMTYMEHLRDNLLSYSPLQPLKEAEMQFLHDTANLIMQYPTIPCNDCKYCMPCPYGIDIPSILLHYNKCVTEGTLPENEQAENYRKARRAFLISHERSVPRLRQANHCIGCNQCSPHCPQSIDIPKELRRLDSFVEHLKQTMA